MVDAATSGNGRLLKNSHAGRRLPGIKNPCGSSAYRGNKLAGQRSDAGEALKKIQGGALCSQQGRCASAHFHCNSPGCQVGAVFDKSGNFELWVDPAEDFLGDSQARDDASFARDDLCFAHDGSDR